MRRTRDWRKADWICPVCDTCFELEQEFSEPRTRMGEELHSQIVERFAEEHHCAYNA